MAATLYEVWGNGELLPSLVALPQPVQKSTHEPSPTVPPQSWDHRAAWGAAVAPVVSSPPPPPPAPLSNDVSYMQAALTTLVVFNVVLLILVIVLIMLVNAMMHK